MSKCKNYRNIHKITTKILTSIIDGGDGRTYHGTDYGPVLHEIKEELNRRHNAQALREQRQLERDMQAHALATEGKTCTKCKTTYAPNDIDDNFYKVARAPHRYRPRCKACHVKQSRINRIKIEEIPF